MKLAQILTKYKDVMDDSVSPLEFIKKVLGVIEPRDYLEIIRLFCMQTLEEISKKSGDDLLNLFFSGLEKNKILSLMQYYKESGF